MIHKLAGIEGTIEVGAVVGLGTKKSFHPIAGPVKFKTGLTATTAAPKPSPAPAPANSDPALKTPKRGVCAVIREMWLAKSFTTRQCGERLVQEFGGDLKKRTIAAGAIAWGWGKQGQDGAWLKAERAPRANVLGAKAILAELSAHPDWPEFVRKASVNADAILGTK